MVIICPTLCISGCAQGASELSYRQVAARDYRVPEGIDRHSVILYSKELRRSICSTVLLYTYCKCLHLTVKL
jgi:hypothetical protein